MSLFFLITLCHTPHYKSQYSSARSVLFVLFSLSCSLLLFKFPSFCLLKQRALFLYLAFFARSLISALILSFVPSFFSRNFHRNHTTYPDDCHSLIHSLLMRESGFLSFFSKKKGGTTKKGQRPSESAFGPYSRVWGDHCGEVMTETALAHLILLQTAFPLFFFPPQRRNA